MFRMEVNSFDKVTSSESVSFALNGFANLQIDWSVGLGFNDPVSTIKVISSQSVYLTTPFPGRV